MHAGLQGKAGRLTHVLPEDVVAVLECSSAKSFVIVEVVVQSLADEVLCHLSVLTSIWQPLI